MTAYLAPATFARATGVERALLRASARIDAFVEVRLARRTAAATLSTAERSERHADARDSAIALAAIGILPR